MAIGATVRNVWKAISSPIGSKDGPAHGKAAYHLEGKRHVHLFQDAKGDWRYRITGKNGEILVTSEPYANRQNAKRGFAHLQKIICGV